MKLRLILCLVTFGCVAKPIPPAAPQIVEITHVAMPPKPIEVISDQPPIEVVHTWITGDELKAIEAARDEEAIRAGKRCRQGDPLCSDLEGDDP